MRVTTPSASAPLSDRELDELDELLQLHSPFDFDGLYGVLHAVAVAPGHIPASLWTPAVLPTDPTSSSRLDAASFKRAIDLMVRLYAQVVAAIERGETMIAPEDDVDGCKSFAAGYVAGAALDPQWRGNDDRWTFASCFAYLAGRLDLVPAHSLAKFEAVGDVCDTLRRQADAVVIAARDSFLKLPQTPAQAPPAARPAAVARKAPCPCGSGKKFKRCCADRARADGA